MSEKAAVRETPDMAVLEYVISQGDLGKLTSEQRVAYYNATCRSLGLNPLTKPFEYIKLNGRLVLYATRGCTDQLRAIHNVDLSIVSRSAEGGVYVVVAHATLPSGRSDESTGVVSIKGVTGNALANAYMKAETKAKRRVTLSIVGLGWLDESELHTIPSAQPVAIDGETGEVLEDPPSTEPGKAPQELDRGKGNFPPAVQVAEWPKSERARFQKVVKENKWSPAVWRNQLGLPLTSEWDELFALGTVGQVLNRIEAALAEKEPPKSDQQEEQMGYPSAVDDGIDQ